MSQMSRPRATGVVRHALKFEGAPFDDQGNRIVLGRWAGVGGVGRAKCSCGEYSQDLSSSLERRAWHRRHKHIERLKDFLSFVGDQGQRWPFTEDDRCNITGFGHQDRIEFARLVSDYDESMMGDSWREADAWSEDDVVWRFAMFTFNEKDDDLLHVESKDVSPDTHPECVPITTIWGQR